MTERRTIFTMNRRERPPKLSRHAKDTARPTIGLFSNYLREGARIAQRKEKLESRRKTFLRRKSRLSIFRKVAEYNPSLKMAENMFTERHLTRRFMALASSNFSSMLLTFYFLSNGKENVRKLFCFLADGFFLRRLFIGRETERVFSCFPPV